MKMQDGNKITGKNIHCEMHGLSENYNDIRESTVYADGVLASRIESTRCLD
ncbi:hypothetical protein K0U27_08740 [archaeon]|nr:hypothetical protein [archaeon]